VILLKGCSNLFRRI